MASPQLHDSRCQAQPQPRRSGLERPVDCRPDVALLLIEDRKPSQLARAPPLTRPGLGELHEVVAVAATDRAGIRVGGETLPRVLAYRLEQQQARLTVGHLPTRHQVARDERLDHPQRDTGDGLRRSDGGAALEDRECTERRALKANCGSTATARAVNSSIAADPSACSPTIGSDSGDTAYGRSAEIRSASRLVTITTSSGQLTSRSASPVAAGRTCSKLSRIRSVRRRASKRSHACSIVSPSRGAWPSRCTTAASTSSHSVIAASDTRYAPSRKSCWTACPTASARRVLPIPPVPVSVSSGTSGRRTIETRVSMSRSRPIREVDGRSRRGTTRDGGAGAPAAH